MLIHKSTSEKDKSIYKCDMCKKEITEKIGIFTAIKMVEHQRSNTTYACIAMNCLTKV